MRFLAWMQDECQSDTVRTLLEIVHHQHQSRHGPGKLKQPDVSGTLGVLVYVAKHEDVLSEIHHPQGSGGHLVQTLGRNPECCYSSLLCAFSLISDGRYEASGRPKKPS